MSTFTPPETQPEAVTADPLPSKAATKGRQRRAEISHTRTEPLPAVDGGQVTGFWSLLDVLLTSDQKMTRFMRLVSFLAAVAGFAMVGTAILLVSLPDTHALAGWTWPAAGSGAAVLNALLLRRRLGRALRAAVARKAGSRTDTGDPAADQDPQP